MGLMQSVSVGDVKAAVPAAARADTIAISRYVRDVPNDLVSEWRALASVAAEPNSFAEDWFVGAGLRHLAAQQVRLVEVRAGGELIGVALLCEANGYARLPVRHARNWMHHHHFLGGPLVRADAELPFFRALIALCEQDYPAAAFLHIEGLVAGGALFRGLEGAAASLGRSAPVVHRHSRAMLATDLSPTTYFEQNVRKKKRKELKRLRARLEDLGSVALRRLAHGEDVIPWCNRFLALEASGWKGMRGSALGCQRETEAFFREALAGAHEAGKLEILSLEVGGQPIAMLVNFLAPPGSFSFKIAIDEAYARFSPGVLIQIENLDVLNRPEIAWMDSCAAEHHSMIESLWGERREIVRVTVRLAGLRRGLIYHGCRALERASATRRAMVSA